MRSRKDPLFWVLMAGLAALVLWGGQKAVETLADWKRARNAEKYIPALNAAERAYGLPTDLLARLAYQESRFRDDIVSGATVSGAGAQGLMQIVPRFHPGVDPLNIPAAIDYAARLLRNAFNQFHSWELALASYNAGPGNVAKYGGIPPFAETIAYVRDILADVPLARAVV